MLYRKAIDYLLEWKRRAVRMPLVIRGARQVGKSCLVQIFAKENFENFIEINFERDRVSRSDFEQESAFEIVKRLELRFNCNITPGKTLLFLDEIQAAPELFAKLRYFHEELPELHVITAGSLLEFMLEEHEFSMPVGRVEYFHLGPMSFSEFLLAAGKNSWGDFLDNYQLGDDFPNSLHHELSHMLQLYFCIGGMPKVIDTYIKSNSLRECDIIKGSIVETYIDDFAKYGRRINHQRLLHVFNAVPRMVGEKVRYVNISRDDSSREVSKALHLFESARVFSRVNHSASRGLPLDAEIKSNIFKLLVLDVALLVYQCGLNLADIQDIDKLTCINNGALAEQLIGQHLLYRKDLYRTPRIHYWARENPSSNAEIDYVIAVGSQIVPIEVKAGKTGSLRSLNQFIYERQLPLGLRFNMDIPSLVNSSGKLTNGNEYSFQLISLPLYMVEQAERMIKSIKID
jgi:predicted AAA+ superfamily ATPase